MSGNLNLEQLGRRVVPLKQFFETLDFPARCRLRAALRGKEEKKIGPLLLQRFSHEIERQLHQLRASSNWIEPCLPRATALPLVKAGEGFARRRVPLRRGEDRATNSSSGISIGTGEDKAWRALLKKKFL